MARLRRRWRVVKWAGVAFAVSVAAVWAFSLLYRVSLVYRPPKESDLLLAWSPFELARGGLIVSHAGKWVGWPVLDILFEPARPDWSPFFHYKASEVLPFYFLIVPLWMPFLLVTIPTAYLFWIDRRIPPHCCQGCGYDLTGNVSGTCPECGERI